MAAVATHSCGSIGLRPTRLRVGLFLGTAAALSCIVLPSTAPAADVDLTPSVLKDRAAVGLPAVRADASVRAAAGALLAGQNAQAAFSSGGGTGTLVTAKVAAGSALAAAQVKSAVFDPRVTALAVLRRDNSVAVAAALDLKRPFTAPVLAGAVVDPGVAGSLAVLFPPGSGTIPAISLQQNRSGDLVTIEIAATAVPGAEGAILVQLKGRDRITGPQLGYGIDYTLRIGSNRSFRVRTRPVPSVLTSRSFASGPGFSGSDRRAFLATVNSIPGVGRKVVDVIGGAITVRVLGNSAPICGAQTSCAGFDPGNGYFLILNKSQLHSSVGRFVITHELGHLVDFLGLDTFSHQDFQKLFSGSPKWKSCFPLRGQCTPFIEVYADQFGFFSTNAHGVQSGYGDDRLATGSAFANVLGSQWAFRPPQNRNPLAGFGPLAKSFEDSLHSGEDAL
jgi:hypothetical protein